LNRKNNGDKRSYILTKETFGATLLLFSAIMFIILLTRGAIFLGFGSAICTFMYGTFGYGSYFFVALAAYFGQRLLFGKKIKIKPVALVSFSFTLLALFLLLQAITTRGYSYAQYSAYLSACYSNAAQGYSGYSAGGALCGLFVYPVAAVITSVGAYVVFALIFVALILCDVLIVRNAILGKEIANTNSKSAETSSEEELDKFAEAPPQAQAADNLYTVNEDHEIVSNRPQYPAAESYRPAETYPRDSYYQPEMEAASAEDDKYSREKLGRKILFDNGEFAAESYRRNMIYNENSYFNHPVQAEGDYLRSFSSPDSPKGDTAEPTSSYTDSYASGVENTESGSGAPSYVYGDEPVSELGSPKTYSDESEINSYTVDDNTAIDPDGGVEDDFEDDGASSVETFDSNPAETYVRRESTDSSINSTPDFSRPDMSAFTRNSGTDFTASRDRETEDFTTSRDRGTDDFTTSRDRGTDDFTASRDSGESARSSNSIFNIFSASNPRISESENRVEPTRRTPPAETEDERKSMFDDDEESDLFSDETPLTVRDDSEEESVEEEEPPRAQGNRTVGFTDTPRGAESFTAPENELAPPEVKAEALDPAPEPEKVEKPKHVWKKYVRPSIDLLDDFPEGNNVNTAEIEESKTLICETLARFRIDSRVSNVVVGPAITRYDVIIEDKTNFKNALKYRDAIAMSLMRENVTAYLNYAKGAISYEVPNLKRATVGLKSMLTSSQFINAKPGSITFGLGKDVEGQVVCPDITKMPHLLVAGTTGSGKSVCLSSLLISLLYKYGPEELRLILVDPKQVEFISYDKLPHLLINEIIYDVDKTIKALNWAIKEMERRYQLFKEMTEKGEATKNLEEYNSHIGEDDEKLPKIVIILDEFGDLMIQAKKDIESRIIRLVQKARAAGIHLILATQRPSVDCITGLIKANLPTRIGFKVNSLEDSRCIFDIGGAEKLLGNGDMYFRSGPELKRIQGCFVGSQEVQKVTDFIKQNNETFFDESASEYINKVEEESDSSGDDSSAVEASKVDDTFIKALWFCVTSNQASVSMIQRRFPIGYMKACKIIDWMANMNYITQSEGSKPRKVLLSREEFIQKYGDVDD